MTCFDVVAVDYYYDNKHNLKVVFWEKIILPLLKLFKITFVKKKENIAYGLWGVIKNYDDDEKRALLKDTKTNKIKFDFLENLTTNFFLAF